MGGGHYTHIGFFRGHLLPITSISKYIASQQSPLNLKGLQPISHPRTDTFNLPSTWMPNSSSLYPRTYPPRCPSSGYFPAIITIPRTCSTPHPSGCPAVSGYTVFPGADHPGDDIVQLPAGSGTADLADACESNADCVSFNWVPDGSWGWLKTGFTPTSLNVNSSACYYLWSGTMNCDDVCMSNNNNNRLTPEEHVCIINVFTLSSRSFGLLKYLAFLMVKPHFKITVLTS